MIEAFECDFVVAKRVDTSRLEKLGEKIENKDERLLKDIELLENLSFNLRHGYAKILEQGEIEL